MEGLKQRLGNFGQENFDFDIKYKGVAFLFLEIVKTGLMIISEEETKLCAFGMKEFCLVDQEKANMPYTIVKSQNNEIDNFFNHPELNSLSSSTV